MLFPIGKLQWFDENFTFDITLLQKIKGSLFPFLSPYVHSFTVLYISVDLCPLKYSQRSHFSDHLTYVETFRWFIKHVQQVLLS